MILEYGIMAENGVWGSALGVCLALGFPTPTPNSSNALTTFITVSLPEPHLPLL